MTEAASSSSGGEANAGALTAFGIILMVFGFLAIGAPLVTGVATGLLVGGLILVSGVAELISAFKAGSWGGGILAILVGVASILFGGLLLARPVLGLGFLTMILAIYLFADGLLRIVAAFQIRPLQGWGWTLFGGIVAMLLGIMIWRQWPLSGEWAIGTLVGLNILFTGWSLVAMGSAARRGASVA